VSGQLHATAFLTPRWGTYLLVSILSKSFEQLGTYVLTDGKLWPRYYVFILFCAKQG